MEKAEQEKGCCRDEHKFFKDTTDQKAAEAGFQMLQLMAAALPPQSPDFQRHYFPLVTVDNPITDAPPPGADVAVYIRNCVFLI